MTIKQDTKDVFLSLIRLGLGTGEGAPSLPGPVDWPAVYALAKEHGLAAVLVDGIGRLPDSGRPPKAMLMQWIGGTVQHYERRFEQCRRTLADMAAFYREHDLRVMVVKGYACCLDWPRPEHRPIGDIDIWQFGQQGEADALVAREKGIPVDDSHHHHTTFNWGPFFVENHYDFLNVHHHRSNVGLEAILKEAAQDDSRYDELYGEKVYLPSPRLHALFLLRHGMSNFAATRMNLRQLLDWAFFVQKHGAELDWTWAEAQIERFGMGPLFRILNAICVEDLGFDPGLFPAGEVDVSLKARVLGDILSPEFTEKTPRRFLPRLVFKFRRWRTNAWKHELCFNESMASAFWSGVKSHVLKPSSI